MMIHTCDLSTREPEAGTLLYVQDWPGILSERLKKGKHKKKKKKSQAWEAKVGRSL